MKKIVALVLSLVMVMGLATVAFAAADAYDLYQADADLKANLKIGATVADYAAATIDAVAAKPNKDGSGSVAYLSLNDGDMFAVKTTAPTVSSYAVTEAGKTTVLYYVDIIEGATVESFGYEKVVTAVKAADVSGKACGQYGYEDAEAGDEFFAVDGVLYKAVDAATENYKLGDKVVAGEEVATVIDHTFVVAANKYDETLKAVVPTTARCSNAFCGKESKAIYLDGKAPAESTVYALEETGYVVALGAAATTAADSEKVESAQTFDAGIAMYVGMSVMAAAGSAVVLKKKD